MSVAAIFARIAQHILVSALAFGLFLIALDRLGRLSGMDLVAISTASAAIGMALGSFCRSPAQFTIALWQRVVFVVWTPMAILLMLALLAVRIAFLMLKVSLKLLIWVLVSVVYLLMPIDLIPDFFIGLGQVDDFLLIVSLAFWVFGAAAMGELRGSIASRRPTVAFP